jgi:hypothetical protein
MVFNIETLEVFKRLFAKKNVEASLREEESVAHNPSSNKRIHFLCTNTSSVISI